MNSKPQWRKGFAILWGFAVKLPGGTILHFCQSRVFFGESFGRAGNRAHLYPSKHPIYEARKNPSPVFIFPAHQKAIVLQESPGVYV
jgi:hypothetical protein